MGEELKAEPKISTATTAQPQGGWSPTETRALVLAIVGGVVVGLAPVVAAPVITVGAVLAAVFSGAGTGLLGWLGLRSAGTQPKGDK